MGRWLDVMIAENELRNEDKEQVEGDICCSQFIRLNIEKLGWKQSQVDCGNGAKYSDPHLLLHPDDLPTFDFQKATSKTALVLIERQLSTPRKKGRVIGDMFLDHSTNITLLTQASES